MANKTIQGTVTVYKEEICPLLISRGTRGGNSVLGFKYLDYGDNERTFYLGIETSNKKLYVQQNLNGTAGDKIYITDTIPDPQ